MIIPALIALGFTIAYLFNSTNNLYFGIACLFLGIFYLLNFCLSFYEKKLLEKKNIKIIHLIAGIIFLICDIVFLFLTL